MFNCMDRAGFLPRSSPGAFQVRRNAHAPDVFAIRPGMRLTGDINIGRRSVLDYVLNPITRVINESLREP
jgi:hypothetical protein